MSLIRWSSQFDPFQDMEDMMNRVPTFMNNKAIPFHGTFMPVIDMYETEKSVKVETPLAGINPKDVQVSVEKGVLTIQGETKKEHEVEEKNYYRKEMRSGTFFRQIALPVPVNEDKVSAEFEDGVLKIELPKATPSVAKKINVKIIKKEKK